MLLMVSHGVRPIANATQTVSLFAAGTLGDCFTASLEGKIETDWCSVGCGSGASGIPDFFRDSLLKF